MMLLAIGLFAFEIPTLAHDELQRRASWDHAKSQRIGARPATQYVGPGEETLSLSGTAWAELQNGRASLDQLREMAGQGTAWPVIDGAGYVYGNFVITGIDERHKHFFANGVARSIDFGIDLLRTDDTPTQTPTTSSAAAG